MPSHDSDQRFIRDFQRFLRTNPSPEQVEAIADHIQHSRPLTAAQVRVVAQAFRDRRTAKALSKIQGAGAEAAAEAAAEAVPKAQAQAKAVVGDVAVGGGSFVFTAEDADGFAAPAPQPRALVDEQSIRALQMDLERESTRSAVAGAQLQQRGFRRQDQHDSLRLERDVYDTDIKRTRAQRERVELEQARQAFALSIHQAKIEQQKNRIEQQRLALERERLRVQARNALLIAGIGAAGVSLAAYFGSKKS